MNIKSTVDYIFSELKKGNRFDGRKNDEYRDIVIKRDIIENAEGSALVKLGNTEVLAGIKMETGTPYPDSPDKGVMSTMAEFLPMASPDFESGKPGEEEIELGRVVDRAIREGEVIDFGKLVIEEGEKVWMVFLDILVTNYDGNLIDAAGMAAMAALESAKMPKLDEEGNILKGEYEGKLPIKHKVLSITARPINGMIYLDCDRYEEDALKNRLTIGIRDDGKITSLQKGGCDAVNPETIKESFKIAQKKAKELFKKYYKK